MAFRLVIAEKPSVAQTIAAALGIKGKQDGYIEGGGYLISWCVGHLVQLAEAAAYGEQYKKWSFDSLPILPEEWQYAVDPDKGKQFKTLKELMHRADVSEVVNACDAGREGELIFRSVYEVAGCKKPMRRLWISSMEDGAIKAGFASLKDGRDYGALFASALCRAKADWLIGINATRLFSCLYGKTLNVGRVQTPTLKMLTDRDAAISHFQKEKYYHVRLDFLCNDDQSTKQRFVSGYHPKVSLRANGYALWGSGNVCQNSTYHFPFGCEICGFGFQPHYRRKSGRSGKCDPCQSFD